MSYGNYVNLDLGASIIPIRKSKFRLILAAGLSGMYINEFYPNGTFDHYGDKFISAWTTERAFDIGFIINIMPEFLLSERIGLIIDLNLASYNSGISQKFAGLGLDYKF